MYTKKKVYFVPAIVIPKKIRTERIYDEASINKDNQPIRSIAQSKDRNIPLEIQRFS